MKHEIEKIHNENNRLKYDLNIQKSHNVEIEKILFEKSRIEQSLEEEVSVLKHMDQANKNGRKRTATKLKYINHRKTGGRGHDE